MNTNTHVNEKRIVDISQSVAILVDGNNIERSLHELTKNTHCMINFDHLIPRLVGNRSLNRLIYFREGKNISQKLAERLHTLFHGSVRPCHKNADIPLSITATQLATKVDTIIIMSGDSDYVELVGHLKRQGVRVEIAAVIETTSQMLLNEADYFHPLEQQDWFSLTPTHHQSPGHSSRENKNLPQVKKSPHDQQQEHKKEAPVRSTTRSTTTRRLKRPLTKKPTT
jgi:uncharacterized LabA/DUF88 family protein